MDEYVKKLKVLLEAETDKKKLENISKDFSNLAAIKLNLFKGDDLEKFKSGFKKAFDDAQKKLQDIADLKAAIAEIELFDKDNEMLTELKEKLSNLQEDDKDVDIDDKESISTGFKQAFSEWKSDTFDLNNVGREAFRSMKSTISDFGKQALNSIKSFVTDTFSTIKEIASWSENSIIYNKEATSLYQETGLQGAEAYGLNKALESQGFSSVEDFYNARPYMNEQQLTYMNDIREISIKQYEQSIEVSEKIQEFEKEYDEFKREMQTELIAFFMNNKDTILNFLKFSIDLLENILKAVSWITGFFSDGTDRSDSERKQTTADILGVSSNTLTTNTDNSKNVSISNTYNGVGKTDESWLANTGQMTYQQVIEALK